MNRERVIKADTITLLIMCKDEFTKVKNIIKSLEKYVQEIVVVITGNVTVSEQGFVKVLYYPWHDDYSAPLNAGLRLCTSCLLYTSPSPRDKHRSRMPSSA